MESMSFFMEYVLAQIPAIFNIPFHMEFLCGFHHSIWNFHLDSTWNHGIDSTTLHMDSNNSDIAVSFIAVCTGKLWIYICICILSCHQSQGLLSQSADPSPDLAISLWKWLFFFMPDKCQYPFQQSAMSTRVSEVLGSGPLKISRSTHPFWANAWHHSQEL